MRINEYVHGYSERENLRLLDQANTLAELLHRDTIYPDGSSVLEAGCGVGAQTIILASNNPASNFTSIDISNISIETARTAIENAGITNVNFQRADIFNLPYEECSFDHIFVCFVLEHLKEPLKALESLKKVLRPGGTIIVIEGDHGSAYYHPESNLAQKTINCLIDLQAKAGGNSLIGRQVYPILHKAGFKDIIVTPRVVYCDSSKPEWVEGFTKNTFIAMVEGVRNEAIQNRLMTEDEWNKGISELYQSADIYGTFNYTFFKGIGIK